MHITDAEAGERHVVLGEHLRVERSEQRVIRFHQPEPDAFLFFGEKGAGLLLRLGGPPVGGRTVPRTLMTTPTRSR